MKMFVFAETSVKTAAFCSGFVMNIPHDVCSQGINILNKYIIIVLQVLYFVNIKRLLHK